MSESTRTKFDRAVRVTFTVKGIDGSDIDVSVHTSTTDIRKVLDAAKMWKGADEGMSDIRRGFESIVGRAQRDSENRRGVVDRGT